MKPTLLVRTVAFGLSACDSYAASHVIFDRGLIQPLLRLSEFRQQRVQKLKETI